MREILFRGKNKFTGGWCEGYLVKTGDHFRISTQDDLISFGVDPATVGQFTSLTDKNGKRIFEGDIVKEYFEGTGREYFDGYADYEFDYYGHKLGVVTFTGTGAKLKCFGGKFVRDGEILEDWKPARRSNLAAYRCEVIGNIHDNPELLKG